MRRSSHRSSSKRRFRGIHEVGFTSSGETLTLRHQAHGRECFAQGAVRAAEWIVGRKGVFTLDDMLEGPSTEEKR